MKETERNDEGLAEISKGRTTKWSEKIDNKITLKIN